MQYQTDMSEHKKHQSSYMSAEQHSDNGLQKEELNLLEEKGKELIDTMISNLLSIQESLKSGSLNVTKPEQIRRKICYCRVSTRNQKDDLGRQEAFLREKYPDYEVIRDIGSGLNFKRKGLKTILEFACKRRTRRTCGCLQRQTVQIWI